MTNEEVIRVVLGSWAHGADAAKAAKAGDVVCTERVDWLVRPDGSRVGPLPIVGVTEFRDGKITSWREYFDRAHLTEHDEVVDRPA